MFMSFEKPTGPMTGHRWMDAAAPEQSRRLLSRQRGTDHQVAAQQLHRETLQRGREGEVVCVPSRAED